MRLAEFQKSLKESGIDICLLLNNDQSVFYFSGIELEKCVLAIPSGGNPYFIVSDLEAERVKKVSRVGKVQAFGSSAQRNSLLLSAIGKGAVIGINKGFISVTDFEFLQGIGKSAFVDVSEAISELRQVKTGEEITIIREACKITDSVLGKCIGNFKFRTELEVKNFLEAEVRELGLKTSFETIVASGKNASMPHYFGNEKLQKGFCVIDFGIRYKGYCSDITRTVYLGSPSRKEKEYYGLVRKAKEKAIESVKEGIVSGDVDAIARKHLGTHSKAFIHGLGHHIGVEVHDSGFRLAPGSKGILKDGMTVTVEPGIYYAGKFGIRIEDDVLVRKNGAELLTKLSSELVAIK